MIPTRLQRSRRDCALGLLTALAQGALPGNSLAQGSPSRGLPADPVAAAPFGSFRRPFSAVSPWNRRPVEPMLGDYRLPPTAYHPYVGPGAYSSGVFEALAGDGPATVQGLDARDGVWHPDEGLHRPITLPRWPASVKPASGTDGHADIVDAATGIVHSFWQLRLERGVWRASQYAWSALAGRGWPDPAHNQQGARAAGVPTTGGLIRRHEVDDGQPAYAHVLALSLDGSALRRGYVRPATAEDNNAAQRYRGQIPIGSLLMLPAGFETEALSTPALRKVAATLQRHGAAVVDQNENTRFAIYVENGAAFDLHGRGWNRAAAADLDRIADALRPVIGQRGWLDGHGRPLDDDEALNLLSMRGPWHNDAGVPVRFDSWQQAVVFGPTDRAVVSRQDSARAQRATRWAPWRSDRPYRFSVEAGGGARLRLRFVDAAGAAAWDSGELGDGQSTEFLLPSVNARPELSASNGAAAAASWARGSLHELRPRELSASTTDSSAKGRIHGP